MRKVKVEQSSQN